jgi:hypothetical protein
MEKVPTKDIDHAIKRSENGNESIGDKYFDFDHSIASATAEAAEIRTRVTNAR